MYRLKPMNLIRHDLLTCDLCGNPEAEWYGRVYEPIEISWAADRTGANQRTIVVLGEALCRDCATSMSHMPGTRKENASEE